MTEKALFTVGVFAGIIDPTRSKILLRRRTETGSIIPGQSFKGNWELPGGAVEQAENFDYEYLGTTLFGKIFDKTGIRIPIDFPQRFVPFPFKTARGFDLALVTSVVMKVDFSDDNLAWASLADLNQMAREFVPAQTEPATDGVGLLSGWGKRMHCMALTCFLERIHLDELHEEASSTLADIREQW